MHIVSNAADRARSGAYDAASGARAQGSSTHAAQRGGGSGAAPAGALGNNAKFPAIFGPTAVDAETGELRRIELKPDGTPVLARPTRLEIICQSYRRKAIIDELLLLLPPRDDGQPHRPFKCHRVPLPGSQVALMYSKEFGKAFFAGLQICANPWLCPHCMRKISEKKRAEVLSGIELAKAMLRRAVLMTLTFRHNDKDRLEDILPRLLQAFEDGFSKRNMSGKLFAKALGLLGTIKALEITWGRKNGHHPHLHVLLFIDADAPNAAVIQQMASGIWTKACFKVGREADPMIGCNVQEGNEAGAYISKMGLDKDERVWGLDAEMTKGGSKNGKATGLSMLQVVDLAGEGDKAAIAAWVQYAMATVGRHTLRWGPKLRDKLGMGKELTDEQIAKAPEDPTAGIFSLLTRKGWKLVMKHRMEPELRYLAETEPDLALARIVEIERQAATKPEKPKERKQ